MDVKKEKIGFIGLGIMGLPMASNLMKDGFDLVVYNRTLSKCTQLEDKGAVVAKNPADDATPKLLKFNFLESRKYITRINPNAGKYH